MLEQSNVATRLPAQDMGRARRFYADKLGLTRCEVADIEAVVNTLRSRGVVFEEYDLPGLKTVNGIAEIEGNYPSKGRAERAAWFKDSEGNLMGIGQPLRDAARTRG